MNVREREKRRKRLTNRLLQLVEVLRCRLLYTYKIGKKRSEGTGRREGKKLLLHLCDTFLI